MADAASSLSTTYEYLARLSQYYRTLDGEPRTDPSTLWTASLGGEPRPPGLASACLVLRLQWMYDQEQEPSRARFGMRSPMGQGRLHFEAYDLLSRMLVGYIGRKGFSVAKPAVDDRFDLGHPIVAGRIAGWAWRNDTYSARSFGIPLRGQRNRGRSIVIDEGQVLEVDPRKRMVRTIIEEGDAFGRNGDLSRRWPRAPTRGGGLRT